MKARIKASELLAASKIASNDEERPTLCAVRIESDGEGKYTIVATDSFKLIEFTGVDTHYDREAGVVLIDAEFIGKNIKTSDGEILILTDDFNATLCIYKKKGGVRCEVDTELVQGIYPKYEQLFIKPVDGADTHVSFNPEYMSDICKAVTIAYGKQTNSKQPYPITINLNGELKAISFHAEKYESKKEQGKCKGVLMPVRLV